jgi:multiple antibiotic resistance protein
MVPELLSLFVLFFVILDPLQSFAFFFVRTNGLTKKERISIAMLATGIAIVILYAFLFFGKGVLDLFNTNIDSFRIAGGILLALLGITMCGYLKGHDDENKANPKDAHTSIATVIATPLLSGPAAITATIISVVDHGRVLTGIAIGLVLLLTFGLLLLSVVFNKILNKSKVAIKVLTTILGLITLAWGIDFILTGLHFVA